MSTTQLTRVAESTVQSPIFPPCLQTVEQSLLFVKRLVAISVSSITYLRTIFPETSYKDFYVDGLYLKMLMDESSCNAANILIKWMKSSFDAVDKGYLREMIFLICEDKDNRQSIIESYTFKFAYKDTGEVVLEELKGDGYKNNDEAYIYNVQKPTIKMLRAIFLIMQSLKDLPKVTYLSMKLLYHENKTPKDYEPEGFCPSDDNSSTPVNYVKLKVGEVKTPFHGVKLRAALGATQFNEPEIADNEIDEHSRNNERSELEEKGNLGKFEDSPINFSVHRSNKSRNILPSLKVSSQLSEILNDRDMTSYSLQSACSKSLSSSNGFSVTRISAENMEQNGDFGPKNPSLPENDTIPMLETPVATPRLSEVQSHSDSVCSMRSVTVDMAPTFSKEFPVRCPCGVNKDDGLMILCDVCSYWQHGACFTIIKESQAPPKHYCEKCASPPSLCTDPRLCYNNETQIEGTCLFRRALLIISDIEIRFSSSYFAQRLGVDISVATKIIEKLTSENILKIGINKSTLEVNKNILFKESYPKYFNKTLDVTPTQKACTSSTVGENGSEASHQSIENIVSLLPGLDSMGDSQVSVDVVNFSDETTLPIHTSTSISKRQSPSHLTTDEEETVNTAIISEKKSDLGTKLSRKKRKVSKPEMS